MAQVKHNQLANHLGVNAKQLDKWASGTDMPFEVPSLEHCMKYQNVPGACEWKYDPRKVKEWFLDHPDYLSQLSEKGRKWIEV